MSTSESEPDLLNDLAHEFAARYRQGERPALSEYIDKYPQLAAEIRDLFPALAVMEQFGSVGGPATGLHISTVTAESAVPQRLGEYRILREVARGGMGIVYEAVQESLGRHVALKVLPFQGAANANHLERFRREAKAAANLHHTNIVPVFGVGESEGVHYYAMQFIQGQGLDSVLQEIRRLRGGQDGPPTTDPEPRRTLNVTLAESLVSGPNVSEPRPSGSGKSEPLPDGCGSEVGKQSELSRQPEAQYFRSVARVGVQVADALAYAHQQGILHRDIKPSNLLLDTQGTIWVTDFGLAKLEGTDELTSPGDIVGTLRYMAPERFEGRGDPRSDVYSLGLTLYELATLQPAFAASARAPLMERILHEEPPRPRRLDARIPRDLETIILKAIAREPGQRYATAADLAEDLRRFLADRPIQARRASWPERGWRLCRRNPVVSLVVAAFLMSLIAGSLVATVLAVKAGREREAATAARQVANRNLRRALRAIEEMLSKVAAEDLQGVPRMDGVQQELLEQALALYLDLLQDYGDDVEVRLQAAQAHLRMALLYAWLAEDHRSVRHSEEAVKLAGGLADEYPAEARYRELLARCYRELGWRLGGTKDYVNGLEALGRSQEIWERLAREGPNVLVYRAEGARNCRLRGRLLLGAGDQPGAIREFREGLARYQTLTGIEELIHDVQWGMALNYYGLAVALAGTDDDPEADAHYRAAADLLEKLAHADPKSADYPWYLAHVCHDLGRLLDKQGQAAEAERAYRRALGLREQMEADFPTKTLHRDDLVESYVELEAFLRRTGQEQQALAFRAQVLPKLRKIAADFPDRADYQRHLKHFSDGPLSAPKKAP